MTWLQELCLLSNFGVPWKSRLSPVQTLCEKELSRFPCLWWQCVHLCSSKIEWALLNLIRSKWSIILHFYHLCLYKVQTVTGLGYFDFYLNLSSVSCNFSVTDIFALESIRLPWTWVQRSTLPQDMQCFYSSLPFIMNCNASWLFNVDYEKLKNPSCKANCWHVTILFIRLKIW